MKQKDPILHKYSEYYSDHNSGRDTREPSKGRIGNLQIIYFVNLTLIFKALLFKLAGTRH